MPPAPKLLQQVEDALRVRHRSPRTAAAYVHWIRRYILFHGKRHPRELGKAEIEQFLNHLAVARAVSASTQTQALSALIFLYRHVLGMPFEWLENLTRAKKPARLPVVLTRAEVRAVLERIHGVPRLVAGLLYGSGLRLMEACTLRIKDLERAELHIRDGKGRKDRRSVLAQPLLPALRAHLQRVRVLHQRDIAAGAGYVELPDALSRKYPNAEREWPWQWVFPASRTYFHRPTGNVGAIISTKQSCSAPLRRHHARRTYRSGRPVTASVTASQRTCLSVGMTSERSKSCSATRTSALRRSTRMC